MTAADRLRVGLEVSAAASPHPGGIYRYITGLTTALAQQDDIQTSLWYRLSRIKQHRHWWRPAGMVTRTYQGRWWPPAGRPDLMHGLDGVLPHWRGIPKVATVHDLAVLLSDDPGAADASFRERKLARYRDIVRRADRVIAVSGCTRQDLMRLFGLPSERIAVVPHGVDARFTPLPAATVQQSLQRYGLEPGYLLYVGVISQRKNTERLVRAYANSAAAGHQQLVLAGRAYHRSRETRQAIAELGLQRQVLLTGEIRDDDLPALYNGAAAFLFPSLYEGFGLPILEAMACGVPVLCANRGGAAETAGQHGIKVNPESVDAISAGIDQVTGLGEAERDAAREYARGYTWRACAQRTLALYRDLL